MKTLRTHYQRDGFVVVPNLLSEQEIGELRERLSNIEKGEIAYPAERIEYEPAGTRQHGRPRLRKVNDCANNDSVFRHYASHPRVLETITQLLGENHQFYGSQCFLKPPGGIEKPYHQDAAYFPVEPPEVVTCWMALDDVTAQNGALWVIPESHLGPLHDHSEVWRVGDRDDQRIPEAITREQPETPLEMPAGSCSFHHCMLMHRSGPNQSSSPRRALALHYMAAECRVQREG